MQKMQLLIAKHCQYHCYPSLPRVHGLVLPIVFPIYMGMYLLVHINLNRGFRVPPMGGDGPDARMGLSIGNLIIP